MKTLLITFASSLFFLKMTGTKPGENSASQNITNASCRQSAIIRNALLEKIKKPKEVWQGTKDQFYHDFGNVTVTKWERRKHFDEVSFIQNGQPVNAFYDDKPALIGTTINKTFNDLPAAAQASIKKNYKDYSIGDIILLDDNELNETDMTLYNQQFDDADNYFIELKKDNRKIVVESDMAGNTSYFTRLE